MSRSDIEASSGGEVVVKGKSPIKQTLLTVGVAGAIYVDSQYLHLVRENFGAKGTLAVWLVFIALIVWTVLRVKNYIQDVRWAKKIDRQGQPRQSLKRTRPTE